MLAPLIAAADPSRVYPLIVYVGGGLTVPVKFLLVRFPPSEFVLIDTGANVIPAFVGVTVKFPCAAKFVNW